MRQDKDQRDEIEQSELDEEEQQSELDESEEPGELAPAEQQADMAAAEDEKEQKPKNKSVRVLLEVIMLCIFAFIILMTDYIGREYSKAVGNVALVICALILVALLFWPSKKK